jgi:hypothetical protein
MALNAKPDSRGSRRAMTIVLQGITLIVIARFKRAIHFVFFSRTFASGRTPLDRPNTVIISILLSVAGYGRRQGNYGGIT